jgi:predicted helicase
MLVQHLLTERLFRTVFDNPDFVSRNVIASEIEKVIQALTSRVFNRRDFLKSLDRFYVAIESAAKGIENWSERQHFLNTVYERFFQGFAVKQADTHGIVYTPQEIVDFMCSSVEEVLQKEFGRSLSDPGVQILDPATGTGNFIVNLIRNHIKRRDLKYKYQHDLFCNEIMLLPYYIASLNIEHEYYEGTGQYEPFEGICFADTLGLAEGQQLSLFVEENTERVKREKEAEIMVVIGNPPYNAKQMNENDNNKNRLYHPQYRERYAENLKRDLPHIPLVSSKEIFDFCVDTGKALMDLHLNYENEKEYELDWLENKDVPFSWRVEKMHLIPEKTAIVANESLTLAGLPPECFHYRLGNRSALEWVIDQYQVSTDKRSGIVSDPNNPDDEEYIVRLVGKVITVSVETVRLVNELAQNVTVQDWLDATAEVR